MSNIDRTSPTSEPQVLIRKAQRCLELYKDGRLIKKYGVALGSCPVGHKNIEGDGKTPEGVFYVLVKNPESKFHRSLGLGYPTFEDARRGLERELISQDEHDSIIESIGSGRMPPQKTGLGGEIYIHGGGVQGDWTRGCIALSDDEMTELFAAVPTGTRVTIVP